MVTIEKMIVFARDAISMSSILNHFFSLVYTEKSGLLNVV